MILLYLGAAWHWVGNLYDSGGAAYSAATDALSASLNQGIRRGGEHQPPMVHGRRIKLRFAHAGGTDAPVIIIHGNQTESVPAQYTRYLEKIFAASWACTVPVKVEYRTAIILKTIKANNKQR